MTCLKQILDEKKNGRKKIDEKKKLDEKKWDGPKTKIRRNFQPHTFDFDAASNTANGEISGRGGSAA